MTLFPKRLGDSLELAVGSSCVTLTRAPVRRYDWDHTGRGLDQDHPDYGHPREQALLRVSIDGQEVALAHRPHGFGKQHWRIDRLGPEIAYTLGLGELTVWGGGYLEADKRLETPEQIAAKVVELRGAVRWGSLSKLATAQELDTFMADYARRQRKEKEETAQRQAQWAREEADRKRRAQEHRDEVLAGLQDIAGRTDLSNLERAAIVAAVARYTADRP